MSPTLTPKLKVWVVLADQVQFGHGRAQLLRMIDELGSIRKAAAQFGMSYRGIWGYLQELEVAAGFPFLERRVGGWGHGGATLTPAGRVFLTQYEAFRKQVDTMVQQAFAACFPPHR
jgi:molybdate transport system regulatory protein